jgi:hypothetical protein
MSVITTKRRCCHDAGGLGLLVEDLFDCRHP